MRKPRNQDGTSSRPSCPPRQTCLAAVLGVLGVLAANSYSQPRLALSDDAWDLGQVNQGPTLTKEVKVDNAGDEPLEITAVESSCPTCLAGQMESKTIPPTGRAKLVLKFFSANVEGKQAKHVILRTNDPGQPEKKIAVTGVVVKAPRPKIKLEPETWDVGLAAPGEVRAAILTVRNEGDAPLRITGLTPSEGVGVDAPEFSEIPPGGKGIIKMDYTAGQKPGLVKEHLLVESTDPTSPTKVVAVTGYVATPSAVPGKSEGLVFTVVELGPSAPGQGKLVARYRIVNHLPTEVRLVSSRPTSAATLTPLPCAVLPGASADLKVELPANLSLQPEAAYAEVLLRLPLLFPAR
ncbi:MAG: DUF1573 domain-containing protein [Planctomycetes bacterium]|nr:DUF1573 domain-containing protein [Planctomycetota bacterium]